MHSGALLIFLASTAFAAIVPRGSWYSGPFAVKVSSEDARYDGQYISPQILAWDRGLAAFDEAPSYSYYYLERTGQLFTATNFLDNDPAVRAQQPGPYDNQTPVLSWSYEVVHKNPAKSSVVSHKNDIMEPVFFAYEAKTIEELEKETYSSYVVLDIKKDVVSVGGSDVWYMCDNTTVTIAQATRTWTALSALLADEPREDCVEVTLKSVKLPKV